MVLISNKGRKTLTRLEENFVPFASFIVMKFIITKTALTKLLKNTLDESSKLKIMSDKILGCLTKSLLSQNFYWTMSDLSKTLILHHHNGGVMAI